MDNLRKDANGKSSIYENLEELKTYDNMQFNKNPFISKRSSNKKSEEEIELKEEIKSDINE